MTNALPGGQRRQSDSSGASNSRPVGTQLRLWAPGPGLQVSRSVTAELASLFPSREVASLLVDTYFDRVHWFMLIFHQDDFRRTWQQLYDSPREQLTDAYPDPGFISTFLVVIAIALPYLGAHRLQLLEAYGIFPMDMKGKILSTIRAKILDIVSVGSLEAVQTCVLLGTYYLYHGNSELAWPVCGCGLRIAQALNLHRKLPQAGSMSSEMQRQYETRKRCWWAIYEIETFCSMSYGYPHSIKDSDCDVELLDPLARSAPTQSPASSDATDQHPASLLSYKYLMSKLSVLIKNILTDLYGLGSLKGNTHPDRSGGFSGLHNLIRRVSALDTRLRRWNTEIPDLLQLNNTGLPGLSYTSVEEMDRDIGASSPKFENHIYQLQALALKLAYENARILVHRPLLAFKTMPTASGLENTHLATSPLHLSLEACRDAALSTSNVESTSIFSLAVNTYAAAFIGIHTFTAGVMLCILTSIEPLAPQSYESKTGLRRLLSMQAHLKSRSGSTLAAQGLEILEKLTRLLMEKELKEMLSSGNAVSSSPQIAPRDEQARQDLDESVQDQTLAAATIVEENMFNYIEDPAMSQALFDFDQVLSNHEMSIPLESNFPDLLGPGSGLVPEQAWIWGVDSLAQLPMDE
ncbi:fungal-specific transcription factor domain-containing protein [Penicillium atrosanguineum]|uniref:Fungal-specific transcription factor domain-containing protein n=1 Tax=Penicillium atrosanguineum TaxID=1132637 RepID=A0A9W9U318_9EURO|nr:fungal-specific transcription factor domain-containing protein [Penicillium atrosanguineum]